MNENIKPGFRTLFTETQRFHQWWLWMILAAINGLMLYGFIRQVVFGQPFGNKPAGNAELGLIIAVTLFITLLIASVRLQTRLAADGIYFRFFPFQIKFRHYPWPEVRRAYLRKYAPLKEYGGWGIRLSMFKNGIAYTVAGNHGIQIELTNGKKRLLGTRKPEEAAWVLAKLTKGD